MRKALQDIARKLNQEKIPWLLADKTAAILQGAMITTNQLIIYTSNSGSYRFGDFFADYRIQKVKYREAAPVAGHIGLFKMHDIDVTVIGEPEMILQQRKFLIPVESIHKDAVPTSIGMQDIYLLPLPWIQILGFISGDNELLTALSPCRITRKDVFFISEMIGATYFLKPLLESMTS